MRSVARGVVGVVMLGSAMTSSTAAEPYRSQVLAVDVTSLVVTGAGLAGDAPAGIFLGVTGLVIGSPIVHVAHGNEGRAAASLGLRVGLPVVGGVIGLGICGGHDRDPEPASNRGLECLVSGGVGFGIGAALALIVDYAVLAAGTDNETTPAMVRFGGSF